MVDVSDNRDIADVLLHTLYFGRTVRILNFGRKVSKIYNIMVRARDKKSKCTSV